MATYTLNGTVMECTGTGITSAGIKTAVDANPACGTCTADLSGNRDVYSFSASLRIGTAIASGTASSWLSRDEYVTINATLFEIYGEVLIGSLVSSVSQYGGALAVTMTASDQFRLFTNGIFKAYGAHLYASHRIRVDDDTVFWAIDCDAELEDGVDPTSGLRQDISYDKSRIHHTVAVGIKLFSPAASPNDTTFSLVKTKVESCTYAFQTGNGAFFSPVLSDVEIDSCTNHIASNIGTDSDVTFINPDFITARIATIFVSAGDVVKIEFRYGLTVNDDAGSPFAGASVRLEDQQLSARFDTLTDGSGNPTTFTENTFQAKTYLALVETDRRTHLLTVRDYNKIWQTLDRTATADLTTDVVGLLPDVTITQTEAAALAHTGITITDHGGSPVSWNGKNFGITITVTTGISAEDLYHALKAHQSLTATYNGKSGLDWHQQIIDVGTYETQMNGSQFYSGTIKGVRVVDGAGTEFPNIERMQADDGTYLSFTPVVLAAISVTNMPVAGANIRLQIINVTALTASDWAATTAYSLGDKALRTTGLGTEHTAGLYFVATTAGTSAGSEPTWDTTVGNTTADGTVVWTTYAILYQDADPASTSFTDSYTDGEEFSAGDTFELRFAEMNAGTSFKIYSTTGLTTAAGFTVLVGVIADSVYATNAVDGSSAGVTAKFTADYANDELDLDANLDFAVTEAFAYFCYELTTTSGMYQFWGGVTAIDPANYRNNVAAVGILFDETAGFVKQTDSARWYRDDDARPAKDPTTGGNGIEINWRNPVYGYDAGGGGFTAGDRSDLQATKATTDLIVADSNELQTDWVNGGRLDLILDSRMAEASINTTAGAVDSVTLTDTVTTYTGNTKQTADHTANIASILTDTGTTLPTQITGVETKIDTVDANVDSVKTTTDQITFTTANQVDSNVQSVNDTAVAGTGTDEDPWNPA